LFFAGFEQSGSSFNIFADKNTDRVMFGYTVPAEWFQAVNPLFVIALAPVMAWMWQWLDRRGFGLSLTAKMGWAMLLLGGGFMLAVLMARHSLSVGQVSPLWLLGVYFFLTVGELCLSPVGLSAFTKLSPARYTAQISGLIAGHVSGDAMAEMPAIFMKVVWISLATGGVLLLFAKPIQKLARGVS
jgi:POT family proton-dependent oligopeptide transporter